MATLTTHSVVTREEPAPSPSRLEALDEVLCHFDEYAGSPEILAVHLQALGYSGSPTTLRGRTARLFALVSHLYAKIEPAPAQPPPAAKPYAARRGLKPFGVYYGTGRLRSLSAYATVVVHPGQYSQEDIEWLQAGGTRVLAYVSLGEDNGPEAPWHLETRNTVWNTRHVRLTDPGWQRHLHEQIQACTPLYGGFLLDTLEVVDVRPEARSEMLCLLRNIRRWAPHAYLLANRGFSLMPELARLMNGVLIESFSTTWEDDYRRLDPEGLAFTETVCRRLIQANLDVYGLDYATTPQLTQFARRRAARLGVPTFVSTRDLHHV